jgi:hypothetical protein
MGIESRLVIRRIGVSSYEEPLLEDPVAMLGLNIVPIREGILKKKCKSKFKDRYFKLNSNYIYYGHNQKSINREFARIRLDTARVQPANEKQHGKYSFELVTPHKVYILKGNNNEDRQKWMYSMSTQIQILSENRILENLNEKIRYLENRKADADDDLIADCFTFDGCMRVPEARQIFYNFIPETTHVFFLTKIEEYRELVARNEVEAVLDIA